MSSRRLGYAALRGEKTAKQVGAGVSVARRLIRLGLAMFLAAYFGSPFLTLHQMRQAAERKDAAALSANIDFAALRASVKHAVDVQVARKLAA